MKAAPKKTPQKAPIRNVRVGPRKDSTQPKAMPTARGNSKSAAPKSRISLRAKFAFIREKLDATSLVLRRFSHVAGKVALAGVCVIGAVGLSRLVQKHVQTSPAFATKKIEIDGAQRLTRSEILASAGIAEGQNVFKISPDEAERHLLQNPWIASADVERRLPATYLVHVRERKAVALLSMEHLYLVAEDGTVFKREVDGDPADLPILTGIEHDRFMADKAYRASILLEVVALLHDYANAGLQSRYPIAEVHVELGETVSLYVGDDATQIRLGEAPFREKLSRLRQVLARIEHKKLHPSYVYLDNTRRPDRVTVRLREENADANSVLAAAETH